MRVWKTALRIVMVFAIILPVLMACSDTEVIGTTTGRVALSIQAVGGSGRYDVSQLQMTSLTYRPADPKAREALGGTDFGLVTSAINLDLGNPNIVSVAVGLPSGTNQPLNAGEYEVYQLQLVQFSLIDEPPLMPGPTCVQKVSPLVATAPGNVTQPLGDNAVFNFDPPARFTVKQGGTADLRLIVDAPGLIRMLERQFACNPTTPCIRDQVPLSPPCITNFANPTPSQIEPFFTIESLS